MDVRIISATNRDLSGLVERGAFREDLYYRLRDVTISLPPLRERKEDIPDLVEYFLEEYAEEKGNGKKDLNEEVLRYLMQKNWPGNVRQLRSNIRQVAAFGAGRDEITMSDLHELTEI